MQRTRAAAAAEHRRAAAFARSCGRAIVPAGGVLLTVYCCRAAGPHAFGLTRQLLRPTFSDYTLAPHAPTTGNRRGDADSALSPHCPVHSTTVHRDSAMTTSVNRRTRPANPRPPWRSPSARELAGLCTALALGVVGGVAASAAFALDFWGFQRGARAERLATPLLAAVTPAHDPGSDPAPAADEPALPAV